MNSPKVAYFSAEIGIHEDIKTYSGGLGILAGDTLKSMADLGVPICGVTLIYKKGYFRQEINSQHEQEEQEDSWEFTKFLEDTQKKVQVSIDGVNIQVKIWRYNYKGLKGHIVPIYFLDTHLEENPQWAQELTNHLYVGNRLRQEIVLGIGGMRALRELGHDIDKYHMNEGHSAFLTLELFKHLGETQGWDDGLVKERCVFTTHTPIPAGHDKFSYDDVYRAFSGEPKLLPWHLKKLAGEEELNMTRLAMSFSSYHNAVSRVHGAVTRKMFPEFTIDHITNGVHLNTWASPFMAELLDNNVPGWREDNSELKKIFRVPCSEIYQAHMRAKEDLISFVNKHNYISTTLQKEILTIGFARRFIQYKDAELIFSNMDNLRRLGKKVQFIFAGKAHKRDGIGKGIMRRIIERAQELEDDISIAFVPDYGIKVAKKMVSGCDLWLNTPIPPNEASGTSGMKAAVNGCLHFSRLDGWAIESFEKNGGGFTITDYQSFITTLEFKIIPLFYSKNKNAWVEEMKLAIGNAASYFNTQRMSREYVEKAYKLNF